MPRAILFGGVNGAGKTTFARRLIPLAAPGITFLNADEIQRTLPPDATPLTAGRALLGALADTVRARRDFALETTLSSTRYARMTPAWRAAGYHVTLHFIALPSADFAVARVAKRVAAGGHAIPEADIRRRFARSVHNFHTAYKFAADVWYHYLSDENGLRMIDER